jgi:ethanolamine utilization protein EutA (predicted chaperonin)
LYIDNIYADEPFTEIDLKTKNIPIVKEIPQDTQLDLDSLIIKFYIDKERTAKYNFMEYPHKMTFYLEYESD